MEGGGGVGGGVVWRALQGAAGAPAARLRAVPPPHPHPDVVLALTPSSNPQLLPISCVYCTAVQVRYEEIFKMLNALDVTTCA